MSCRDLLFSLVVLLALISAEQKLLLAQDDPSQRMLPLPQRDLPDLKQQRELLKKLRSLIESKQLQDPPNIADAPDSKSSADPQQFEQLRNALQNLQEKLPPGFVPPDLSAIPPEQLKKIMENPAVQQQMREMLKQFSEDRDSKSSEANRSSPLPPASMKSLQDFLKKLTESPPPDETPQSPSVTEPPRPRHLRKKEYGTSPNRPRPNDSPATRPAVEPRQPGAETPAPDAALSPGQRPPAVPNPRTANPGKAANPGITNPRSTDPVGEPSPDPSAVNPNPDSVNAETQQRALKIVQDLIEEMAEQNQHESRSSPQPGVTPRSNVSPPQGSGARTPQTVPPSAQSPRISPSMDIQMDIPKELERNGFGETLKKIVEKARQESRQPKPSSDGPTTPDLSASAGPNTSPGLEQSMIRMLDGMKDDLAEIAKEGKFREPSRRPERQSQRPSRRESETQSNSTLNQIRKAASDLFSAPAKSSRGNNPAGGSSSGSSTPTLDAQFDLTPVAVLAGLLIAAAAGFFGLRFLKLHSATAMTLMPAGSPIAPAEIQNRADVIRAFHEFAMRSTKSVQSWWTHRAVERVIVAAAPEKKDAVETLANAYEQARYLPQDVELSSDQIQSARNALQQCSSMARV